MRGAVILRRILLLAFNLGLFLLVWGTLVHNPLAEVPSQAFLYGPGNAFAGDRQQLTELLQRFAQGYEGRRIQEAGAFVDALFVKNDPLVLGTLPREHRRGSERVKALVRSDWEGWGDCRFHTEGARLSQRGEVAWFTLRGQVRFDLSRFLVVPLRLTGVALREPEGWRLQQVQFQFDVDLSRLLPATFALLLWLAWNLGWLGRELWRLRNPSPASERP